MSSTFLTDPFTMRLFADISKSLNDVSGHSNILLTRKPLVEFLEKDPVARALYEKLQNDLLGISSTLDDLITRGIELDDTPYIDEENRCFYHVGWETVAHFLYINIAVTHEELLETCNRRFNKNPLIYHCIETLRKQDLIRKGRTVQHVNEADGSLCERKVTCYSLTETGKQCFQSNTFSYTRYFNLPKDMQEGTAKVYQFPKR